jgi:hypothetical protein
MYIAHRAIVLTHWNRERLELVRDYVLDAGAKCSGLVESNLNGYWSFFVAPDGSKEGCEESDAGDKRHDDIIVVAEQERCDWVEVRYGGDSPECACIERHCGAELLEED